MRTFMGPLMGASLQKASAFLFQESLQEACHGTLLGDPGNPPAYQSLDSSTNRTSSGLHHGEARGLGLHLRIAVAALAPKP